MTTQKCNLCGAEFDIYDAQEGFHISNDPHTMIGYGSIHDGEYCNCKLCCTCFDKVMNSLGFLIDPFSDGVNEVATSDEENLSV